jgi:HSP20 family protein
MSELSRWEPVLESIALHEPIDRLFEAGFPLGGDADGAASTPAIDLYQTVDTVVVTAALPGLGPEDVCVSVFGDMLTLQGKFSRAGAGQDATWHIHERQSGSFEREIMLPAKIQPEKAHADFEKGTLTITLPKAQPGAPRVIAVKAK